ncbi:MAG: anhydro-N-acetylmuramic acid kinase [Acidobacteria bacterium]|nr:anhydro-N-acetylmuramic acid kinase [Acidobacteriota bacterium]
MRAVGVMSGTSLDGVDVAVVDLRGEGWNTRARLVAFSSKPYPRKVREAILAVSNRTCHTAEIARLNVWLAEHYAERVIATCSAHGIRQKSIGVVGCHGQTIFHESEPVRFLGRATASTLQIGDGSFLAERLGITVVHDFRMRDMAAGGKGAPLVPYLDYLLFRHRTRGRVALNLGGIGNITAIPGGAESPDETFAFDTGPGNMVMDQLAALATGGRASFDLDARIGRKGKLNQGLLDELMKDRYLAAAPPKTAGREQYGQEFIARLRATGLPLADLMHTAAAFTARSVAAAVDRFVRPRFTPRDLVAAGGGVHNPLLMAYLSAFLPDLKITTTAEHGIDPDAKEAVAFAVLAAESIHLRPSNLTSATGARHRVILGKINP